MEGWLAVALIGLASGAAVASETGRRPAGKDWGEVVVSRYLEPGGNDLLSGGLGAARLADPTPVPVDPADPESLRTAAIFNNYRALIDTTPGGGYGRLYGPLVAPTAADAAGRIYGVEYLTLAADRHGDAVTLMVQIPQGFDPQAACIVMAPSSGSRGVYGAIGTAGEWGLKRNCAVAYTDKGTGTGAHDLARDEVGLLRGERVGAESAGSRSTFTAPISERQRQRFNARYPDRFAWKHAHSRANPEARWGQHVLRSLDFAFYALNRELAAARAAGDAPLLDQDNTLVIASSVSNGGAASLRAAELARPGLIDGVVVAEPNVNPVQDRRFAIRQGGSGLLRQHSRPLYDYLTLVDLYQGCANLAPANQTAPLNLTPRALGENRCTALRARGLLRATDPVEQAEEAQRIINGYGILPEQNAVAPGYWASYVAQAVAVTYANAYARASVLENLCGFSFAAIDTDPASATPDRVIPLPESAAATLFATANGIPPTAGVTVVNNDAPDGA
ncbi:MAG TPA: 3-hydroxybutyrate oligomer hydrolase family protein, partial [Geminicoccus sp.]|uniref:3-hydroxybutyrate oligomer hydrolase family protein n=1 Tax=Geminicoccus sp. TaxID=2024832 RepID=UPI002C8DEBAC